MAFLQAKPTSTRKPIWVKMLMSILAITTPVMEHSRHMGTTRMTANGSDQLSYCAASTRNTNTTASAKTKVTVLPAWSCRYVSSVQSNAIDRGNSLPAISCIRATPCPELVSGEVLPVTAVAEYML